MIDYMGNSNNDQHKMVVIKRIQILVSSTILPDSKSTSAPLPDVWPS